MVPKGDEDRDGRFHGTSMHSRIGSIGRDISRAGLAASETMALPNRRHILAEMSRRRRTSAGFPRQILIH
jgi:hypothetical protein